MKKLIHLFLLLVLFSFQEKLNAQLAFSLNPSTQCYSGNNTATAVVAGTVAGATNYTWTLASPGGTSCPGSITFSGTGTSATMGFSCCGVYTVQCSAWNMTVVAGGTLLATSSQTATIVCPNFVSIATNPPGGICAGSSAMLTGMGATSYTWSTGFMGSTVVVSPSATACYSVLGYNSLTGCTGMASTCFSVHPNPVANFNYVPGPNGLITYSNTSTGTNGSSIYQWNFPGGTPTSVTGSTQVVPVTYTSNGNYPATFTVANSTGCWDSAQVMVNVTNVGSSTNCPIIANFSYTQGANGLINFTNLSMNTGSFVTFNWNFGTSTTSSGFSPSYSYPNNGTFTVTLTVQSTTNAGCSDTHTAVVTVTSHSNPACNAMYIATANPGGNVTYTSISTGVNAGTSYTWNFWAAGTSSTGINLTQVARTYTSSGLKWVTLSISNPTMGCSSMYLDSISVNAGSSCSMNINYTPPSNSVSCNGSATVVGVSGMCPGPITYTWMPGAVTGYSISNLCSGVYTVFASSASSSSACCSTVSGTVMVSNCSLAAVINTLQTGPGSYSFSSSSTGTSSNTVYNWNFGDGTFGSGPVAAHSYSLLGTYTVVLNLQDTVTNCSSSAVKIISISGCALNASFSSSALSNGLMQFTSTSTIVSQFTQYSWDFGYGFTPASTTPSITQQFYVNGSYPVRLAVTNSLTCKDTVTQFVNVTNTVNCNINAAFSFTTNNNGNVLFTSTSTGTNVFTSYTWNYGDNSNPAIGYNLVQANNTYSISGIYLVTLTIKNNLQTCTSVAVMTVAVTNTACSLSANFNHTVGTSGSVTFSNTTVGSNTNTTYHWNFGDGFFTTAKHPVHTFISAGVYYVTLKTQDAFNGNCKDSITQALNITGINCVADPNFTLVPTGVPKFWNAIPAYPWNVTAATWQWGDGTSSNGLYTSHLYSVSANYNICVSVTVSCGSSASACATYYVYRPSEGTSEIISVNVVPPGTTVTSVFSDEQATINCLIYPNPNNGSFTIRVLDPGSEKVHIELFDFTGKQFYKGENLMSEGYYEGAFETLLDAPDGIYFVRVSTGNKTVVQKMMLRK